MDLSHLIDMATRYNADTMADTQRLPHLSVYRRYAVSDIEAMVYEPVICLILQGSKVTGIGDRRVQLRPGDALLVSHDLPVLSRITDASAEEPYIAVILSLDLGLARSLYGQVADAPASASEAEPLSARPADPAWLAPLTRYFELMDSPMDAKVLGPSTLREIHYRLLTSPIGRMLRRLLVADSHASRIAKAIQTVRADFRSPLSVPELAKTAGMSASSFHEHFKSVTGTTPLQYQKDLRLIEARALLVEQGQTVSETAHAVGYESATHFSRDYSRKFGLPPSRDARVNLSALQETLSETASRPTSA
ncbi:MAG: AraC family transcriptional regulator [Rhodobacter sp.]|nr:AraC family transcriptional regulator [Rhodobacter sp.]